MRREFCGTPPATNCRRLSPRLGQCAYALSGGRVMRTTMKVLVIGLILAFVSGCSDAPTSEASSGAELRGFLADVDRRGDDPGNSVPLSVGCSHLQLRKK